MKAIILLSFCIILSGAAVSSCSCQPAVSISAFITSQSDNIYYFTATYGSGVFVRKIPLIIINYEERNIRNEVWILHGYKPEGDPYFQDPGIIAKNWNLQQVSCFDHDIFFIPDMGSTIYPLVPASNETVSDIKVLSEIVLYFKKKLPPEGLIFTGISTGSEGAVKLASLVNGVRSVVCLSGTFDYYSLSPSSGEYKIHEKIFDRQNNQWKSENPLEILKTMKKTTVYVFSEENSIFRPQAEILINSHLTNIDVIDETAIGNGFSHNWDFWKSPGLYSNLITIFGARSIP